MLLLLLLLLLLLFATSNKYEDSEMCLGSCKCHTAAVAGASLELATSAHSVDAQVPEALHTCRVSSAETCTHAPGFDAWAGHGNRSENLTTSLRTRFSACSPEPISLRHRESFSNQLLCPELIWAGHHGKHSICTYYIILCMYFYIICMYVCVYIYIYMLHRSPGGKRPVSMTN